MRFISSLLVSAGLALSLCVPVAAWGGTVDINTADATTLARELNGIGPARAAAIVAYRTQHGPFKTIDDLALVKNIPQKVIDTNRSLLSVGGASARAESRSAAGAEGGTVARAQSGARRPAKPAPRP